MGCLGARNIKKLIWSIASKVIGGWGGGGAHTTISYSVYRLYKYVHSIGLQMYQPYTKHVPSRSLLFVYIVGLIMLAFRNKTCPVLRQE